jgi:hypothetical protein
MFYHANLTKKMKITTGMMPHSSMDAGIIPEHWLLKEK